MLSANMLRRMHHGVAVTRMLLVSNGKVQVKKSALYPVMAKLARTYATKNYPAHTVINMPALSPTMTTGNIGAFQKKIGDKIEPGDVLCEIETDKAQIDFEQQDEGYLAKILIETGTKDVPVGKPLAVTVENEGDVAAMADFTIEDSSAKEPSAKSGEEKSAPSSEKQSKETSSPSNVSGEERGDRVFASPLARKLAEEKDLDLSQIRGSGPNGRIIKVDIENFKPVVAPKPSNEAAAKATTPAASAADAAAPGDYEDLPLSNMRKIIASRLAESKNMNPHYYVTVSVNMEKIIRLRAALNAMADGRYKLSVNDLVIKATTAALRQVPEVNAAWMGDFIRQYKNVDISMAVATPSGLITPVIRNTHALGLAEISTLAKDYGQRARNNKLKPEEYQGGTFTISNLGMFPVDQFTAIINPPQACILAVGTTVDTVVPDSTSEKGFKVAPIMKCTLSSDHRVVDGAMAARFTTALKKILENPLEIML
ncbi:Acetyltransferase component of pyruvate dehydrogenase complex [Schizosaccharomyces pombe]|uniref:Dihydrolipoyllysine-residue acetyltransferase component of pyruvate dehydrogenase complex, mitochondrial n=1 Tax=Schizosaccharomyces pombe (strain 972 / ATCC 24843) TaxID=284812 RepID=ODP2_SCHPO|nr:putative dihydrolipoamide S-acetyltransferase E2 Lat1 [Schizosaccharomyces pombe]O59816.1 RecName: Full=Dihydrolipoyllysine-residue acetyltransferase component of pyruvate dehydrogenase complex, mitochondrial; AltName: Full=Dihydrolipoamide acetyltransferase component of pyruvate dehydrogenase complex; AltName: Full=Pyruvate dehydrogenase complex component E2; Short=PDC-E2; Short=PDCE2; Flags: Precursor [Schizosaccharomyces pombe 972h-]CAA19134.1 dihydrolipoamide S-acetyltransferase E2, Lat1 (|eukprot:NP_587755.1 putative dihydrolipoamide S-acetyltransferase E2 Lat1 [Schizosaccharomyces pombe]